MLLARVKAHEELKTILTPEQRKRLKEMMEMGHGPGGAGCGMMGNEPEHKDMPMQPMQEHTH